MAGPSLQLNITAPGQKSVEGSVTAVRDLARALRELPAAGAALAALQKQLGGVQAPSGLKTGASDMKALVGEIKNLGSQLNNSFASLEQTIKDGWKKAANAEAAGEAALKSRGGRSAAELAEKQRQAIQNRSALMTTAYAEAAAREVAALQARAARIAQAEQRALDAQVARQMRAATINPPSRAARQQDLDSAFGAVDLQAAERQRQAIQNRSALMATAAAEADQRAAAAAARTLARENAAAEKADEAHRAAFMRDQARQEAQRQALQNRSALMATAQGEAAAKETAAAERQRQAIQNRSALMATAAAEAAAKETAAAERQRQAIQNRSALMATAHAEAAAKEAAAMEARAARAQAAQSKLDAAYAAMGSSGRARTVLSARAQLDNGLSPEAVQGNVGSTALAAAQATNLAQAYGAVHDKLRPANAELAKGAPAVRAYGDATKDLQAGLRGLASGFGQVSLIASSIIPLLAGTALSKGFTFSIKMGAEVRQDLDTLRVLSEESESAVAGLEKQLISLGQTGPFGPRQVAEAMKTLSLAGLSAIEVGQALKPALDFAVTGGVGIEKAAESLVAIGTAYGYQANEFSSVADAVSKAAAVSMSSVEGMMESFRASSMVAQGYGVTLKDTAADLALLANVGIRGSAAGTALRQMYSELSGASRITKQAMKDLGVEVLQQNGNMKPAIQIVEELSKALSGLRGDARVSAIQAISNERGGKGLIATLTAFETAAKDAGSTAENEFVRIKRLIDESAGFDAIAASKLANTPMNLFKGVGASLESAMFEAFKAIEPTLTVLANQVREVFNSSDFRSGLTSLVEGMAAFSQAVIQNIGWLKLLGEAFLIYKGLQILQITLAGGAAAMTALGFSTGAASAGLASTAAAATATVAPLGLMAGAARGLSVALGLLGPLSIAIGVAALAWQTYSAYKERANNIGTSQLQGQANTLQALDDEILRLETINKEMRKGADLRDAQNQASINKTRAENQAKYEAARAPDQAIVDESNKRLAQNAASRSPNAFAVEHNTAQRDAAQARLNTFEAEFKKNEDAISFKQQVLKSEAHYLEQEQERRARLKPTGGTELWGGKDPKAAAMAQAQDGKELQTLQQQYQKEQQLVETAYKREMELLDIKHKGKLIAEAEYVNLSDQASKRQYAGEMSNLQDFIEKSGAVIARLKGTPKAGAALADIERDREKAVKDLEFLKAKNDLRSLSRDNTADLAMVEDLAKLTKALDLEEAQLAIARQRADMMPEEAAGYARRSEEVAKYTDLIRRQGNAVALLEDRIDDYVNRSVNQGGLSLEDTALVADLRAQLERAQSRLAEIMKLQGAAGGRAQDVGTQKYLVDNKPTWQKFIAEGENAMLVLKQSRDNFMNGWVDAGRNIWSDFLETGKLSFSSLGKLITKSLADITYQRYLVKPFASMGEKIFDTALKPVVTADSTSPVEAGENLRQAFSSLGNSATGLSQQLGGLGSDFWRLFVQAGQGLAAMLSSSGMTGAGGFLSGLFGSSPTAGDSISAVGADAGAYGAAWAKGGAFNSGVQAFAKGAMMNSVISSPHMFRFGMGGKNLGVAGEAGPEAIVPLARTSSGELGIRNVGGGGGRGGGATVIKNDIVIENHGAEIAQQTQSRPDGSQFTKFIVSAVSKDMMQGGQTRKAQKATQKSTPNLPRY